MSLNNPLVNSFLKTDADLLTTLSYPKRLLSSLKLMV